VPWSVREISMEGDDQDTETQDQTDPEVELKDGLAPPEPSRFVEESHAVFASRNATSTLPAGNALRPADRWN